MASRIYCVALLAFTLSGLAVSARQSGAPSQAVPAGLTNNPFPQTIAASEGVIEVSLRQFASLPDIDNIPRA